MTRAGTGSARPSAAKPVASKKPASRTAGGAGKTTSGKTSLRKPAARTSGNPRKVAHGHRGASPASSAGRGGTGRAVPASRPAPRRSPAAPPIRVDRPRGPRIGSPHRRMQAAVAVALAILLVFCGRLIQIQGFDPQKLAVKALAERLQVEKLPATRGSILAADGTPLATSVTRYELVVDQKNIQGYAKGDRVLGAEGAAAALAPVLQTDPDTLQDMLTGDKRWKMIAQGLSAETWRSIQALGIPGLTAQATSQRSYPDGAVAGNLVGFVGSDGKALAGLELSLNSKLTGKDGSDQFERGRGGTEIPLGKSAETPAVNGESVQLTINSDLQWYAQQQLEAQVKATKAEYGTAVLMNPKTGEILAAAEAPTVDPNYPGGTAAANRQARVFTDSFEPGSVAKVVTASALIQEGKVSPASKFSVPGLYKTPNGQLFHDSHPHDVEKLTFAGILAKSSNIGTIMAGQRLTKQQRYDYLSKFGFGRTSGTDFPGESGGILHQPQDWDGRTQYAIMFGQGVAATAIQTASAFSTIANNGVRVTPQLVKAEIDPDGTRRPVSTGKSARVVSAKTAKTVREMMEGVVDDGTGTAAAVPGYAIAGKTGTAQAPADNGRGYDGYTASFIGMAPANDPQLVLAVTLQRPRIGHDGGPVAGPVFSKVMSYALQAYGVPPSNSKAKPPKQTWKLP